MLWRNDDGADHQLAGPGRWRRSRTTTLNAVRVFPNEWQIAGIGDFNGDGQDDVLWRNADGLTVNWLGQANGGLL